MNRAEAIKQLKEMLTDYKDSYLGEFSEARKDVDALNMAIEALKAQDSPIICPRCGRTFAESEGRETAYTPQTERSEE